MCLLNESPGTRNLAGVISDRDSEPPTTEFGFDPW